MTNIPQDLLVVDFPPYPTGKVNQYCYTRDRETVYNLASARVSTSSMDPADLETIENRAIVGTLIKDYN
jgi:hypothetical protein